MENQNIDLDQYICSHIDREPELLTELDRQTHLRVLAARMLSGHLQGTLMKMIVRMINPRLVLELGTFTGYSALSMAEGLSRPDAHIHTIEIDDELEPIITEFFSRSEHRDRITLHIGDAKEILPTIEGEFDLVFIDANKRHYPEYYEMVMPRVAKGGYILADNTLWDNKVLTTPAHGDTQTQGIMRFNDIVAADQRVEKVILPIRDGLTLIRKI